MADRTAAESQLHKRSPRLFLAVLLTIAAAALAYVAHVVAQRTIDVVRIRRLMPRWDLATHLGHGWLDYHLLATGRIVHLLWDLWLQGYWPPMLSVYQVPFYLVLGGGITAGLWSGLVAFILTGLTGSVVIWRQRKDDAALPASLFLALLMSSPFLLAYASVPMTEMLGALTQLLVLLAYVHYRRESTPRAARLFAASLTVLFFTKYNYFFLLVVPLVLHEWLERTSGWDARRRLTMVWRWTRRILSTPAGALLSLYVAALLIISRTGGFEFRLLGRRIAVHTIGNTGHVVLYLLLGWVWYLHRRGRIDWARLTSADPRVSPLLRWFVVPVTIWLASPYPNHIRDFANLVLNRPLGESGVGAGVATYVDVLRTTYFYNQWILASVVAAFSVAMVRYRHQPPLMQWLILAVPLQFAVIAIHQTRFPRFLLLTVVLLCLVAASEVGQWFSGSGRRRAAAGLLAPLVLVSGVATAREVMTEDRFRAVAFENYTDNEALRAALDSIRAELTAADRLAIVGQGNWLSPALFRWELGPPSGLPCFPFEVGGARGTDLTLATRVLLIAPLGSDVAPLDVTSYYLAQRRAVMERVERGDLVLRREVPLPEMHVGLRLYDRVSQSDPKAPCF
jgi:hypothetical protein